MPRKPKQADPAKPPLPKKTRPPGAGKPPHVPTEQLRNLVSLAMLNDMTHVQTARLVGIDEGTLRKHYAEELSQGKDRMLARVAANIYRIAQSTTDARALTAGIFVLKSKGGWNDRAAQFTAEVETPAASATAGKVKVTLKIGDREREA